MYLHHLRSASYSIYLFTGKDCGPLSDPANGKVDTSAGTKFTAKATYSCSDGFEFCPQCDNTVQRTCEDNGWSGEEPKCQGE